MGSTRRTTARSAPRSGGELRRPDPVASYDDQIQRYSGWRGRPTRQAMKQRHGTTRAAAAGAGRQLTARSAAAAWRDPARKRHEQRRRGPRPITAARHGRSAAPASWRGSEANPSDQWP
ncbi:hypothetical protein ACLOJK_022070 [Asimina triloba]